MDEQSLYMLLLLLMIASFCIAILSGLKELGLFELNWLVLGIIAIIFIGLIIAGWVVLKQKQTTDEDLLKPDEVESEDDPFKSDEELTHHDPITFDEQGLASGGQVEEHLDLDKLDRLSADVSWKPHNQRMNHEDQVTVTYEDFKKLCMTDDFLQKFTLARKKSNIEKHTRLVEVYKETLADLEQKKDMANGDERLNSGLADKRKLLEALKKLMELYKTSADCTVAESRKRMEKVLYDPKYGMEKVVGGRKVKDFIALQIYTFANNPKIFCSNFQNTSFNGPAGIGKTYMAQMMGNAYANCGIVSKSKVSINTASDFTTAFVRESGPLTRRILLAAIDGIIFIDEAYELGPTDNFLGRTDEHAQQAVTELVNVLDKLKGLILVIVAGYKEPMEKRFFGANEGLSRRFPHKIDMEPYDSKELTNICIFHLRRQIPNIKAKQEDANRIFTYIDDIMKSHPECFVNSAGDAENLAGDLARAINGSIKYKWGIDNGSKILIDTGVNKFLEGKGFDAMSLHSINRPTHNPGRKRRPNTVKVN